MHLDRFCVTSVRMGTLEPTVRSKYDWEADQPNDKLITQYNTWVCVFRCASGFYGNPQVVGGTCVRCECNGNVDISEAGHCDTVTGECLRCLGNTAGRHCELCRPGYYGDAVHTKDCRGTLHISALTSVMIHTSWLNGPFYHFRYMIDYNLLMWVFLTLKG